MIPRRSSSVGVSLGGLIPALALLDDSSSRRLSGSPTRLCRVLGVSIALTSKMNLSTATFVSGSPFLSSPPSLFSTNHRLGVSLGLLPDSVEYSASLLLSHRR
ncbi:hypothetical protein F2Q69_00003416 [Brassica cretica]|uniref:Uncharacterized protein n=1 Tax=Brassica cretica TaxID=69181 RepID=A0A8S9P7E4_BRACR|nr:hypothetical protein F2Q69_00003416 [Brassica cretica]